MPNAAERFLLIASHEKGHDFMRQCAEMDVSCTLLTLDALRDATWPPEALDDLATMPPGLSCEQILNTVSWMARGRRFDRVVALDAFDLATAAEIREHMRIPGMGVTTAAYHRDRLAMSTGAQRSDFLVPEFSRIFNYDELRAFMERVPPPWLLKPRAVASVAGIQRIDEPEQLWRALDPLGDRQSHFFLEQFVPGDIFYVDALVSEREVVFSAVHHNGQPPVDATQEGGVSTTRTVDRASPEWRALTALNAELAPSFGMMRGVIHAEYIRADADGRFYFLEIAARVGGALIADLVEIATGVNLWREWARLEVAELRGESYPAPRAAELYAGSVLCPAGMADTSAFDAPEFDAPEIVRRIEKRHHAGLIVRSENAQRVDDLLEQYGGAFAGRFLAKQPPQEGLSPG
jgi:biotin carboxylase